MGFFVQSGNWRIELIYTPHPLPIQAPISPPTDPRKRPSGGAEGSTKGGPTDGAGDGGEAGRSRPTAAVHPQDGSDGGAVEVAGEAVEAAEGNERVFVRVAWLKKHPSGQYPALNHFITRKNFMSATLKVLTLNRLLR